jgi:hypothetical protein
VQGEKRHFQPIARLFVIKKKFVGFFSRAAAIFSSPFRAARYFFPLLL